jgi:hypothetical protein
MSVPESQETPWAFETANPERVRAVKERLMPFGVTAPKHVALIVAVLDQHGLFHEVLTPKEGDKGKEIWRRAKRMAKALCRRITNIRNGQLPSENLHEAALAQRWDQLGKDRMNLEKLKVMSETFQINRGGRIIPRYASLKRRTGTPQGPRSEPEITHALQILDRYLKEECSMRPRSRMECLGDILRSAMDLRDLPESVIERVRWRLRDAKTPLDNVDYYEATGVSYKTNDDRQEMFRRCMAILHNPETSIEEKNKAEETRRQLFPFDWSRLR